MKKSRTKIIVIIACIAVGFGAFIGIYSTIKSSNPVPEDATQEHVLMAYFRNTNWGCESEYEGFWAHTDYNIYYDGTIDVEYVYRYRGIDFTSTSSSSLSSSEFETLKKCFNKFNGSTTNYDACDGAGWHIETYEPDGEINYTGDGYIYGDKNMEDKVIPILQKHDETSLPTTLRVEDMPGYKTDGDATHEDIDSTAVDLSNQVYIEFKQRYSEDDSYVSTYTLYYDGTFTVDSPTGTTSKTDTLTQDELQALQFYEYYFINGDIPEDDENAGYAYTIYDEAGNVLASANYDEPVNNHVMEEMVFLFYIPYDLESGEY